MSKNRAETGAVKRGMWKRLVSFALALALLSGFVPGLPDAAPRAEAAEWMESYLETLVDWGVMQGNSSGNLNPDRRLTRAEFVVMINRSFGYTEKGDMPFTDVPVNAWYADDFNIAYNAGYFTGSTATTADPTGHHRPRRPPGRRHGLCHRRGRRKVRPRGPGHPGAGRCAAGPQPAAAGHFRRQQRL